MFEVPDAQSTLSRTLGLVMSWAGQSFICPHATMLSNVTCVRLDAGHLFM